MSGLARLSGWGRKRVRRVQFQPLAEVHEFERYPCGGGGVPDADQIALGLGPRCVGHSSAPLVDRSNKDEYGSIGHLEADDRLALLKQWAPGAAGARAFEKQIEEEVVPELTRLQAERDRCANSTRDQRSMPTSEAEAVRIASRDAAVARELALLAEEAQLGAGRRRRARRRRRRAERAHPTRDGGPVGRRGRRRRRRADQLAARAPATKQRHHQGDDQGPLRLPGGLAVAPRQARAPERQAQGGQGLALQGQGLALQGQSCFAQAQGQEQGLAVAVAVAAQGEGQEALARRREGEARRRGGAPDGGLAVAAQVAAQAGRP